MNNTDNHDDDLFDNEGIEDENVAAIGNGLIGAFSLWQLVYAIIAFGIGLFFVVIPIASIPHMITYVETTATVVDSKYDEEIEMYVPIYEYTVGDQTIRTNGPTISRDPNEIEIGEVKEIAYNPKNYKQFDVGTRKSSLIFFLIGVFLLVCSISYAHKCIKAMKVAFKMGQDAQG